MILRNRAAKELRLKTPARANTSDEEVLSQETSSRKRALGVADPDPEKKLRITKQDDKDATVAISSGSSYQAPETPTQCSGSAPNDPVQWHLATNHQDGRWLSSQVSVNDRGRDPLSDISLNATNVYSSGTDSAQCMQDVDSSPSSQPRFVSPPGSQVYEYCHVDQRQRTGESISDTLRLERTGISTISALLNHDNNTPATAFAITQDPIQDSEDGCPEPVSGVAGTDSFRSQRWLLIVNRSPEFR
jgi:hypothetical protein